MDAEPEWLLTPDQLRQLDASYVPIPSFAEWARGLLPETAFWDEWAELFRKGRLNVGDERAAGAINGAMRAASVNTGAIEGLHGVDRGLTFSVVEQASTWETAVAAAEGPKAVELVRAALEGYEMALDISTGSIDIHESWIRQLHQVVCGPQRTYRVATPSGWQDHPLEVGAYKTQPNHVRQLNGSLHPYAPVGATRDEMHRFVTELRSKSFGVLHPAMQAAYVHHAFTSIHPFPDGNGRVARVLASVYSLRSASVPFVVMDDQKAVYFNSLALADDGHRSTFVNFVIDRVVDTLEYLVNTLRTAEGSAEEQLAALRDLLTGQGGLSYQEIDLVASRMAKGLAEKLEDVWSKLSMPAGASAEHASFGGYPMGPVPSGFRAFGSGGQIPVGAFQLTAGAPANATVTVTFQILMNVDETARHPFLVMVFRSRQWRQHPGGIEPVESMKVRLDEVFPGETTGYQLRMQAWAERLVRDALQWLIEGAQASLEHPR